MFATRPLKNFFYLSALPMALGACSIGIDDDRLEGVPELPDTTPPGVGENPSASGGSFGTGGETAELGYGNWPEPFFPCEELWDHYLPLKEQAHLLPARSLEAEQVAFFERYCRPEASSDWLECLDPGHPARPSGTPEDCYGHVVPYMGCIASAGSLGDCNTLVVPESCDPHSPFGADEFSHEEYGFWGCQRYDETQARTDFGSVQSDAILCGDGRIYSYECQPVDDACSVSCDCKIDGQSTQPPLERELNSLYAASDLFLDCGFPHQDQGYGGETQGTGGETQGTGGVGGGYPATGGVGGRF